MKQALAFVTGDPEPVTTAVVTEAGEIQLVDSEIMMVEPVGLLQQAGVENPAPRKIDLDQQTRTTFPQHNDMASLSVTLIPSRTLLSDFAGK